MSEVSDLPTEHPNVSLTFYHYDSFLIFSMKEFTNKTISFCDD
jgi:hypothetical protein